MVQVSNARLREPVAERGLVLLALRAFEKGTHGSRKSIFEAVTGSLTTGSISFPKLAGIIDTFVALGLLSVYKIHGRAEVYELSEIGKWVLRSLKSGHSPAGLLLSAARLEGEK